MGFFGTTTIMAQTSDENDLKRYVITFSVEDINFDFDSLVRDALGLVPRFNITDYPTINSFNFNTTRFQFEVRWMPKWVAGLIARLPFVEAVEEDVTIKLAPPLFEDAVWTAGNEVVPYGIQMVGVWSLLEQINLDDIDNTPICIVDTGYDLTHFDLPKDSTMITGENFSGEGEWYTDENGHGEYIFFRRATKQACGYVGNSQFSVVGLFVFFSGTHVAGTIAALGTNGDGLLGNIPIGPVKLHIVKYLNGAGEGDSSNMLAAIASCQNAGAKVMSMSLGGSYYLEFQDIAFKAAYDAGMLLVAAAGNDGAQIDNYPASYSTVISVSAVDNSASVAPFSNWNENVEIAAPGVDVWSTIPGSDYGRKSGTSMACPHVSAVAAILWSKFPDKANWQVRQALAATAIDIGVPGRDVDYGYGLVNAPAAYEYLEDLPAGPMTPPPTRAPTSPPTPEVGENAECQDSPINWVDAEGDGCSWYEGGVFSWRCSTYGDDFAGTNGRTANEACCGCGGGSRSASSCTDNSAWRDSFGDGCEWYEVDDRCSEFGTSFANADGLTASTECCACRNSIFTTVTSSVKNGTSRQNKTGREPVFDIELVTASPTATPDVTRQETPTATPASSGNNWNAPFVMGFAISWALTLFI